MDSDDSVIKKLANEQRKNLVRGLMFYFEAQPWWRNLADEQRKAIRSEVYDKTNAYHDFIVGVINVTDQGDRNENAVEVLSQVLAGQQRLERLLSA